MCARAFLCPIICLFSKNSLSQKKAFLKFNFGKHSFCGLLKHYKLGVQPIMFKKDKNRQKDDSWTFWFCSFGPGWLFRDAHLFFKKCFAETPILIALFG